ncbi:MAG: hypothetical protein SFW09_11600 [Hyphomicrobiaceae bacterium]|nr:hypothetical protein [Hyphomicrobiaceae bacterium]
MSILKSLPLDEIRRRGTIRDSDVSLLRSVWADAEALTAEDADELFGLHGACPVKAPSWSPFFIEALTEYVVHQATPVGYVVAENARWLTAKIGAFGRVETSTELALLVHVIETARWAPPSLAAFALAQVREAIASGTGPLRAGHSPKAGTIAPEEVELVARIIGTHSADIGIPITRGEADALIAINRAITPGGSSPAWSTLFIRCIGSAVLAALGHAVPARHRLLDEGDPTSAETFILLGRRGSHETDRPRSECRYAPDRQPRVWSTARLLRPEERALARLERQRLEIVTNEVIEDVSDVWLMSRLGERASLDDNEIALITFVAREASRVPRALADFASRAVIAA